VKKIEAYAPAGISSFFAICDRDEKGNIIRDPLCIGAIGGGFKVLPPIKTIVEVEESSSTEIEIYINGSKEKAETSRRVVEKILSRVEGSYRIKVRHEIPLPVGAGFGTSGAGALSLAVALTKALGLNLTILEAAQIAHIAEVEAKTGLGTVGGLLSPTACVITRKPGAPGIGIVDGIPLDESISIVAVYFGPILTKHVLADPSVREKVNRIGWSTLQAILRDPSLENFLEKSMEFARITGFITPEVKRVIRALMNEKIIGYAQNMLGNAVHIVIESDYYYDLLQNLRKKLGGATIIKLEPTTLTVRVAIL